MGGGVDGGDFRNRRGTVVKGKQLSSMDYSCAAGSCAGLKELDPRVGHPSTMCCGTDGQTQNGTRVTCNLFGSEPCDFSDYTCGMAAGMKVGVIAVLALAINLLL